MQNLIKLKDSKIIRSIIEISIFIMCIPIFNILIRSLFALGQLVGTYTRLLGY